MWTCSDCGEKIESNFDACWKCGTPKGGMPPPSPSREAEPEPMPWAHVVRESPEGADEFIPSHLVEAILTTLCCCTPFGIVALVFAAQVGPKLHAGDREGAKSASESALTWIWVAVGAGLLVGLLSFVSALAKPGSPSWNPGPARWPN